MNLITNASEALGEKEGVISVSLVHIRSGSNHFADSTPNLLQNEHLRLAVSDTGSGMTQEIQARIFDPFFTTKFTGRGLGLAAVQGIIKNHGGTINVVQCNRRTAPVQSPVPVNGRLSAMQRFVVGLCLLALASAYLVQLFPAAHLRPAPRAAANGTP